ncbi:MAG: hypothetical protein MUF34_22485 [Polyangiaceae bacterium]|nr:hypothetical protein [Polyangiaceae bacterium]
MLPPFIIEQIRKREEESLRRDANNQPRLELPIEYVPPPRRSAEDDPEDADRGCVILDLG